jgi:hypothetical protein
MKGRDKSATIRPGGFSSSTACSDAVGDRLTRGIAARCSCGASGASCSPSSGWLFSSSSGWLFSSAGGRLFRALRPLRSPDEEAWFGPRLECSSACGGDLPDMITKIDRYTKECVL